MAIYRPAAEAGALDAGQQNALDRWHEWLAAFRAQDWPRCDSLWPGLVAAHAQRTLQEFYSQRLSALRVLPYNPAWDGSTHFDTK